MEKNRRSYKSVIQEAELLAAAPEFVAEFLKSLADPEKTQGLDDKIERALRSRSHPLIDLALARYGRDDSTVSALFNGAPPGHAIRLAALSNTSNRFRFPLRSLFRDEEQAANWVAEATPEELDALFDNPTLDSSFLLDLLERSKPWDGITDEKFNRIVNILGGNARMRTPRQDKFWDGFAESTYSAVFNAAWKLAQTVEPTDHWARTLGSLYEQLLPEAYSINQPLALVYRWESDASDAEIAKKEADKNAHGWLTDKQRVRRGLGRLELRKNRNAVTRLLNDKDVALRCAAYAAGALTPEQLTAAYEKDGELVFNEARNNTWLWQSAPTRAALRTVAWRVVDDSSHDLMAMNFYNGIHEQMLLSHPDWFEDEESEGTQLEEGEKPATRADIHDLTERLQYWFDKAEDDRKAVEPHERQATKADIEDLTEWLLDRFGNDKDGRNGVYAQEKPVTKADIEALSERLEESFAKDEGELETEKPATKADMTALVNRLLLQLANTADTQALAERLKQLEQSNQTLLKLNSRVSWICWLLLVALIASLLRHC